jgi:hypothetical protein
MRKSDTVIFTFQGAPAGMLLRERGGFVLYSSVPPLDALDGTAFRTVGEARAAVRRKIAATESVSNAA